MTELVVVANRLPVHQVRRAGRPVWEISPGGLVSAITPLLQGKEGTWVGWTGRAGGPPLRPFVQQGIRNVPVQLSRKEVREYYEGFSNATLWPLYHDCIKSPVYLRTWWRTYVEVNRRFAAAADEAADRDATVWVQDYHLQLVPAMLRERRPDLSIGFFLHIPFPPQELFSQLPWRREILEGLLGADVVGFQRRLGAVNFGQLAKRYTEARGNGGVLELQSRSVAHAAFPISIDFERFRDQAAKPEAGRRAAALRRRLGEGRRIFLGVDRLDYTKGLDVRLKAFRELIHGGGATLDDCVLVQTAVPSREEVTAYRQERMRIEALVGEINGSFGAIGRAAVHYLHKNLPFEELVSLYLAADVMLVTPLRDGMNLVSKEFAASRVDERGVLILSEFAGAADELRTALLVNPHDVDGLSHLMARALAMSPAEERRRMRAMRRAVQEHDVHDWARSFLDTLRGVAA